MSAYSLRDRCLAIELLVLDVDGVLSDGGIIYTDTVVEAKAFHVRDGAGLTMWHAAGKHSGILTGRESTMVERRAAELGVTTVSQGVRDKLTAYQRLLEERGLRSEQACVVGDDLSEAPLFGQCGLAVAVADACAEVRWRAHYVTSAPGGRGAVRETIELILRCQGHLGG